MKCEKCKKVFTVGDLIYHDLITNMLVCVDCGKNIDKASNKIEVFKVISQPIKSEPFSWDKFKKR